MDGKPGRSHWASPVAGVSSRGWSAGGADLGEGDRGAVKEEMLSEGGDEALKRGVEDFGLFVVGDAEGDGDEGGGFGGGVDEEDAGGAVAARDGLYIDDGGVVVAAEFKRDECEHAGLEEAFGVGDFYFDAGLAGAFAQEWARGALRCR